MVITKKKLRQIIKEEVGKLLSEEDYGDQSNVEKIADLVGSFEEDKLNTAIQLLYALEDMGMIGEEEWDRKRAAHYLLYFEPDSPIVKIVERIFKRDHTDDGEYPFSTNGEAHLYRMGDRDRDYDYEINNTAPWAIITYGSVDDEYNDGNPVDEIALIFPKEYEEPEQF